MFNLFLSTVSSEKRPQIEGDKTAFNIHGQFSKEGEFRNYADIKFRTFYFSVLTIRRASFYNCKACEQNLQWQMTCGGAIFVNKCTLKFDTDPLSTNRFYECQATDKGGAIYAYDSIVNIWQTNFIRNWAGNQGGAYYHDGMRYSRPYYAEAQVNSLTIQHCTFTNNLCDFYGGAVAAKGAIPCNILDNKFLSNGAVAGGAFYGDFSEITMKNNLFVMNFADHNRGCGICQTPHLSPHKYLPAGACLIQSSPDYYPVNVYSENNCYNQNYILNNKWKSDKSKISINLLLLFAVKFTSRNDKMKYFTANYIHDIEMAKKLNNNRYPAKFIEFTALNFEIRKFDLQGTSQDVEGCKIDGYPREQTSYSPNPTPYPTPVPPATPFPTRVPPPTPKPTDKTPNPTEKPTQSPVPTPAPAQTPIPTPVEEPTINVTNASEIEAQAESNVTSDCGNWCKEDSYTPQTQISININNPSVSQDDSAKFAGVIGRNTASPDDSKVGFIVAAIAAVAAVGVIAGIIYTLTRSKPPPVDFENAEQVNMDNGNPAVENDNPIYNNNAAQDPFANEFEDA